MNSHPGHTRSHAKENTGCVDAQRCPAAGHPGRIRAPRPHQNRNQAHRTASRHPHGHGPALLDEIPYARAILLDLPLPLKAPLLVAFAIMVAWNKPDNQASVRA